MHYSQAKDYIQELGGSPYRSMLLNDVVLGNAVKLYSDDSTLTQVSLPMLSKVHSLFWLVNESATDRIWFSHWRARNYVELWRSYRYVQYLIYLTYLHLLTRSFAHSLQGTAFVSFRILHDAQPTDRTKRFDLSSWSSTSDLGCHPPLLNNQGSIWSAVFSMYNKWNDIWLLHSNSTNPMLGYPPTQNPP